jgi:hypothetical protein
MLDKAALEQARDEAKARRDRLAEAIVGMKSVDAAVVQRELDRATGYHAALEATFDKHYRFPVAPGTILHGIDVSRLDWQTRAMVMARNLATIYALGGKPDPT